MTNKGSFKKWGVLDDGKGSPHEDPKETKRISGLVFF